jgi:hypothetical protein
MKNLYTKTEFLYSMKEQSINEGFIGKMFKNLWKSVVKYSKNIKGSNEINVIYDKYKKLIDQTFNKMLNIDTAETANKTLASEEFKSESFIFEADETDTAVSTETEAESKLKNNTLENTEDKNDFINLSPEKIAKVVKLNEDRINQLKTQFETEINNIVKRLSKNPDYSSDKLMAYSIVMKNQFNSYLYDQWYGFYQKSGDKTKLTNLIKNKKEAELKFKKSLDDLNTKLSEQQKQLKITPGKTYKYDSRTDNKEINVKVIGKELGKDENGKPDNTKPETSTMWKVETDKSQFWVKPSAFKSEVIDQKK